MTPEHIITEYLYLDPEEFEHYFGCTQRESWKEIEQDKPGWESQVAYEMPPKEGEFGATKD